MQLFEDPLVKEYISSLDGKSFCQYMITKCQCIYSDDLPINAHQDAKPLESTMRQPYTKIGDDVKINFSSLSEKIYYPAKIMKDLIREMLISKEIKKIEKLYCQIDQNLKLHPPCADYMISEYRELFLSPNEVTFFDELSLWKYLLNTFECLINGTSSYGDSDVYDLAFQRFFAFCVRVLQMDYDFSKKKGTRPLIMDCLNYNPSRKTRLKDMTKYLDMLFNSGYDFLMSVVNLAILVDKMKSNN